MRRFRAAMASAMSLQMSINSFMEILLRSLPAGAVLGDARGDGGGEDSVSVSLARLISGCNMADGVPNATYDPRWIVSQVVCILLLAEGTWANKRRSWHCQCWHAHYVCLMCVLWVTCCVLWRIHNSNAHTHTHTHRHTHTHTHTHVRTHAHTSTQAHGTHMCTRPHTHTLHTCTRT
jgi:hypothetical protein